MVETHYRLSVKPHVNVILYVEGERSGITIANPGLGPAIIKDISVEVGGKSYSAAGKRPWQNVFRDLTLVPGCFWQRWVQPGTALKSGEELALLTVTHANPPVVGEHQCRFEVLKLLKAEGLKVRIQYESMYGEPHETIGESPVDSDMLSDIATVGMQQMVPKLVEQLQNMTVRLTQLADRIQQSQADVMKRMPELMLLRDLYEDPPGAPRGWLFQQRSSPINPQDGD